MSCLLRKKRIFISQPMRGIPDEVVLRVRDSVKKKVEERLGEEVELIDQFIKEGFPNSAGPLMYLGDSIMKMDQADLIVLTDTEDWSFYEARGCLIEHAIAMIYGLEIINLTKPISKLKDEFVYTENMITTNKKRYGTRVKMSDQTFNLIDQEVKKENG